MSRPAHVASAVQRPAHPPPFTTDWAISSGRGGERRRSGVNAKEGRTKNLA